MLKFFAVRTASLDATMASHAHWTERELQLHLMHTELRITVTSHALLIETELQCSYWLFLAWTTMPNFFSYISPHHAVTTTFLFMESIDSEMSLPTIEFDLNLFIKWNWIHPQTIHYHYALQWCEECPIRLPLLLLGWGDRDHLSLHLPGCSIFRASVWIEIDSSTLDQQGLRFRCPRWATMFIVTLSRHSVQDRPFEQHYQAHRYVWL